jgi:hypothetical protein
VADATQEQDERMLLLLNDHLSSAHEADAARAGRQVRPRRDVPGRVASIVRTVGRRTARVAHRPTHA